MNDKTIGVGLIGCGGWGQVWHRVLTEMGVLRWVVDPDPEALTKVDSSAITLCGMDYEDVNKGWPVEAVVIATPPDTHYNVFRDVMELPGIKGILVEKPLAPLPGQAQDMYNMASSSGITLSVGHTFTHSPAWRATRDLVPEYGMPRLFEASWRQPYAAVPPSARNAGLLWDLGPHPLSLALDLLPGNAGLPNVVQAKAGSVHSPLDWVDIYLAWLSGGQDFRARIHLDYLGVQKERVYQVSTANAGICGWPTRDVALVSTFGSPAAAIPLLMVNRKESLATEAWEFLHRTLTGRPGDADKGVAVVEILKMVEEELG